MSEYKVVIKGKNNIDWLQRSGDAWKLELGLTREQAQSVVDSLVGQGIAPDIFGPNAQEICLLPTGRILRAPTEKKPAAVTCPRCGGLRVELRWFAGDQVRIVGCSDCGEKKAREQLEAQHEAALSKEEAERRFAVAIGLTVDALHDVGLRAERCDCGSSLCPDWRMVSDSIVAGVGVE